MAPRSRPAASSALPLALAAALLAACDSSAGTPQGGPEDDGAALSAVPYLGSRRVPEEEAGKRGVTIHDSARAFPGVTTWFGHARPLVQFLDMKGTVLHTIDVPGFSGSSVVPFSRDELLLVGRPWLLRVRWNGDVVWRSPEDDYHHAAHLAADGTIYALRNAVRRLRLGGRMVPVRTDLVQVFRPDGSRGAAIEILPLVRPLVPQAAWNRLAEAAARGGPVNTDWESPSDILHTNWVVLVERDLGPIPKGSLLICVRNLDLILATDPAGSRLLWRWGPGVLERPHDPVVMDNGHIMIFDNRPSTGRSRVVEVDPASGAIAWDSDGTGVMFHSRMRGHAQPLPNGNVVVSESDNGRILEMTRAGEIVWEFWSTLEPTPGTWQAKTNRERLLFQRSLRYWPENAVHGELARLAAAAAGAGGPGK